MKSFCLVLLFLSSLFLPGAIYQSSTIGYQRNAAAAGGCSNIVTNGDFAALDCTGWSAQNGLTCDASSGEAALTNSSYGYLTQSPGLTNGATYSYAFDVTAIGTTQVLFQSPAANTLETITATGSFSGQFVADADNFRFIFNNADSQTITIDNVEICYVSGP